MVRLLGFRARLLLILALFAAVPAIVVTIGWGWAFNEVAALVSGHAQWDRVAETGIRAMKAAREAPLTPAQKAAINAHEVQLGESVALANRVQFLWPRFAGLVIVAAALGLGILAWPTWRVAGHLSRQLSRPLDELVGWTETIAAGRPLPPDAESSGAPEFAVLRARMRTMAAQLEVGRAKAIEAERLRAFRESSRRFAHELKNPLTPIRFAITRLRRDASPDVMDTIDVLATESERLEAMARSFAQFGRLPEGPAADVDLGELVRYAIRATVPEKAAVELEITEGLTVRGQNDALARAFSNLLLNAIDACGETGRIVARVSPDTIRGGRAVRVSVRDNGPGIVPEKLASIWEPYITNKPGGTGLGLAIARQSVEAHGGEVFAESAPGNTVIGFVLPINEGLPAITGEWHAT